MYFSQTKRRNCLRLTVLASSFFTVGVLVLCNSWIYAYACETWGPFSAISICVNASFERKLQDLFYRLGGNGPWIRNLRNPIEDEASLPVGCLVDQVHMISRHAERFPTTSAGTRHLKLLKKIKEARSVWQDTAKFDEGALGFLNTYEYFVSPINPSFEQLTSTGPYAGTLQAFTTGQKLRSRYAHLNSPNKTVNFWSCDAPRDVSTARHFARGFFGPHWEQDRRAKLHVIPESESRGGDTLTPGKSCPLYRRDMIHGRNVGYVKLAEFQWVMAQSAIGRLREQTGGLEFNPVEIFSMMEMCGFEILARGFSPWCELFSDEEWLQFEYARDLLHFYRSGPGNKYAGTLGWLWLNATKEQLVNTPATGTYFSFVHDGDIIPLLASMGILDEPGEEQWLPSTEMKYDRRWRTGDWVPMGGRLVFERITCSGKTKSRASGASYVRLLVNDGVVDLSSVAESGHIERVVELSRFAAWVDERGSRFEDFRALCGLGPNAPARVSFLHQ